MSFLGDLAKALIGRPVGQNPDDSEQSSQPFVDRINILSKPPLPPPKRVDSTRDERGFKIVPEIEIQGLQSHRNVDKLSVTGWIANNSDQRIKVHYIELLKKKTTFEQEFGPGQSRNMTFYSGPIPTNENEHRARLVYELLATNDNFRINYRINYHLDADGSREINNLIKDGPVQDM